MPKLHNAKTKSGFFIRWQPHPDHGRPSTYQITDRALRFLSSLGYKAPIEGDEVEIPHELCRPLRILGDLHFENEESPGNVDLDQTPSISNRYGENLSAEQEAKLQEYIETHPRLTEKKESELSGHLSRLDSDPDIQLDMSTRRGEQMSNGPAASVDIDPSDFFDDQNILGPEIEKLVRGKEPPNVGDDVSKKIEEAIGQIDRSEYYDSLTDAPGYKESLHEFESHSQEVTTIELQEGLLSYSLAPIEHPQQGKWFLEIQDGRRASDDITDLHISCVILADSEPVIFKHEVAVDDGQFVSWSVRAGEENITETVSDSEAVHGATFHQTLHDRSWLLGTIEEFVMDLENAVIGSPTEWKELDE